MPLTLLGGYLGAGKSTLLNHLLAEPQGRRLALIINDFGAINIDAALIESSTEDQINLTNGCVCCGAGARFDEALENLLARHPPPDHIVVEASGVADVISLAQYGHHPGLTLDGIVVVADAETVRVKAKDKYVADTVIRQLEGADLILLNKTDLVSTERRVALEDWLAELAPDVPVVSTEHCQVPTDMLLGIRESRSRAPERLLHAEPAAPEAHSHAGYTSWHFSHPAPLREDAVLAFVDALPDSVLRAKGFFSVEPDVHLLFQRVGRRQALTRFDTAGGTEIVAIGLAAQLDAAALDAAAAIMVGSAEGVTNV